MSITFANAFTYAGHLAGAFMSLLRAGGTQAPTASAKWGTAGAVILDEGTMYSETEGVFAASGLTTLFPQSQLLPALIQLDNQLGSGKGAAIADLKLVWTQMVQNDNPQASTNLVVIMTEFMRQMRAGTATVNASTVGSSVAAGANNVGNPAIVVGLLDQNGYSLEYTIPEAITLRCTTDSKSGSVSAGSETLSVQGQPSQQNTSYKFLANPGSGFGNSLTVVDPAQGNGGGQNLLTGSTGTTVGPFKAFSAAVPTQWVADVDAANISDGTSSAYAGLAHCLQFTGNTGGTNLQTALYQQLGSATLGSSQSLQPGTVYLFCMRVKASVVPAAGVLSISLTDGSGTVINDNAGNANTITSTVSGYGSTAYQTVSGTFRTPNNLPATVRLRIKATTPITTGTNVFMDYAALTLPTQQAYGGLYAGGPTIAVFRGSTDLLKWVNYLIGDIFTVTTTNTLYSSLTPSFQINVGCQMLQLQQSGLIFPSSGSPSIADSLIT